MTTDIHFAMGGAILGPLQTEHIEMIAGFGLPGIEPYRGLSMDWVERPRQLQAVLDANGVRLITCSNGGAGQSVEFIDPAARAQTIADHVTFCRDFLAVFGCTWFKVNMGRRPEGGTTQSDIEAIATTLNQLGRETRKLGITIAPHPHIWGPIERPEEVRRLLELTDPELVSWIPDTAQLNLGGGEPLELMRDHYERLAAVHWKDSKASYRGYRGPTPTPQMHAEEILYKDLGAGGCDIPGIWQLLVDRGYAGWITLDLDPPRPQEGEGTVADKIAINVRYLKQTLQVGSL